LSAATVTTADTGNFIATSPAGSNRHAANTSGAAAAAKIGSNVVHYPTETTTVENAPSASVTPSPSRGSARV